MLLLVKDLENRKKLHRLVPIAKGRDHGTEFSTFYMLSKSLSSKYVVDLIAFALSSFDFYVLENIYKIILKQSFGIFPIGNISEKEGVAFFVSLGSRPHIPEECEIPYAKYFEEHDKYFDTNLYQIAVNNFSDKTIPLHHIVWMLSRNEIFTWISLRNIENAKKKNIFNEVEKKLLDSVNFLKEFDNNVQISIAIGYNGSEKKIDNCQSLGAPHFHITVLPSKKLSISKEAITKSQEKMYLNLYLILAGKLKTQISELIKKSFEDMKARVVAIENATDLFNQITFKVTFEENPQKIRDVLFAISELEKNLGFVWQILKENKIKQKNYKETNRLVKEAKKYLTKEIVRRSMPGVPGFTVIMILNNQNDVVGVKISPANHGPAEETIGAILKM